MYCGNCGKSLESDASFCTKCGEVVEAAPLVTAVAEVPQKMMMPYENVAPAAKKTPYLIGLALVLLAIAFLTIGAFTLFSSVGSKNEQQIVAITKQGDIYTLGKGNVEAHEGKRLPKNASLERYKEGTVGGTYAFLVYDEGGTYSLVAVTDGKAVLVADGVGDYLISGNGKKLLYAEMARNKNVSVLTLYDIKTKEKTVVSECAFLNPVNMAMGAAISYDGETVAFSERKNEYKENIDVEAKVKVGKKDPEPYGDGILVLAISDGGERILYGDINKDETLDLMYKSKKDSLDLVRGVEIDDLIAYTNQDVSQVIFAYEEDMGENSFYFYEQGKTPTFVTTDIAEIYASNFQTTPYDLDDMLVAVLPLADLREAIFTAGDYRDAIYQIDKDGKGEKIDTLGETGFGQLNITLVGDYLFYLDNDVLYRYHRTNAEKERVVSDVYMYRIADGGDTVYYLLFEDEALYMVNKTGKVQTIAEEAYWIILSPDEKIVYMIDEENLYSYNGKELFLISSAAGASQIDVEVAVPAKDGVYYLTEDGDVYYGAHGKTGEEILGGVAYLFCNDNKQLV